jgi:replicative DNA helicase
MTDPLRNEDAERTTLGCALLDKNCLYSVQPLLRSEDFSLDSHRRIYSEICELANNGKPVDVLSLTDVLIGKRQLEAVGGAEYLASLSQSVDSELARVTNVEHYAGLIVDKSRRPRAHAAAQALLARTEDSGVSTAECLAGIQDSLLAIEAQSAGKSKARHVKDVLKDTLATLEKQSANNGVVGMPTGLHSLDVATGGIRECELWTIGALPGKGKTALGLQMLMACGQADIPSCAFSLEMQEIELGKRILAAKSHFSATQLRNPQCIKRDQWPAIAQAAANIAECPIWIDDSPSLTVIELLAKARLHIRKHKVKLIVVDYLRLIEAPGKELRERVGFVANAMRQLAKTEKVGVVLLSQLRRPHGGTNDYPTMLDLKESGDIEAHSHVVLLPYLPTGENGAAEPERKLLIIGKNRNGSPGHLPVYFDEKRLQFRDRG